LFVIMLLGVDRNEVIAKESLPGQRPVAICLGILALAEVLLLAHGKWSTGAHSVSGTIGSPASNVQQIGKSIFTTYLLAFEVTSALLVVAVVGAVVLARRPRGMPGPLEKAAGADLDPDDAVDAGPEPGKAELFDASLGDGEPDGDRLVVEPEGELAESEVPSP